MRFLQWTVCALVLGLVAPAPAAAKPIKKQKDFMSMIVGKKLEGGDHWILISADGKLRGVSPKGEKIIGAWVWNKRFFCRNVFIGKTQLPENCGTVETEGNTVTFTRDKGKGRSVSYSF
ncbi:MAG: hypothetical protein HWE35_08220 [Rhodobacteraceae bacterium]|nr:hypothetical protein [Paracoccaceae bacterium]